jgi:CRISPR-associated protein Cmr1
MFHFGGLGARSRNGFGSLFCATSEKLTLPQALVNITERSFTAFSSKAKIYKFPESNTWTDALSDAGLVYRDARLKLEDRHTFLRRSLIAMPIEAKNERIPDSIRKGRHAKPYFIHVGKLVNGKYQGQILFVPYRYFDKDKAFSEDKLSKYNAACDDMDRIISAKTGGAK